MGNSSASDTFDTVAEQIVNFDVPEHYAAPILRALFKHLRDQDWDTEDESYERWKYHRVVTKVLHEHGVGEVWTEQARDDLRDMGFTDESEVTDILKIVAKYRNTT